MVLMTRSLVLASGSPRRRVLLRRAGFDFTVAPTGVAEARLPDETATEMVVRLAAAKAMAAAAGLDGDTLVLGADTAVVLDGEALGKPQGPEDAVAMLLRLGGREHSVLTGYCLVAGRDERVADGVVSTGVVFRSMEVSQVEAYVATGEAFGKAGGYAIQGIGRKFVAEVRGSFTNVMGLPMELIAPLLVDHGVSGSAGRR